ncbi:MAG TPA: hypothetical protein VFK31_11275 [Rhodanobacteraceae bacterium]|nr:hypothetical protein [Rhodanobacteraceae bacterium]
MRTTITLDPDVEALLKKAMRENGLTFKDAVNQAVRTGLGTSPGKVPPFKQRVMRLGQPRIDLTKALALSDELDDNDHGYTL